MLKGYGQFCPVAKASEIFATRWTPLVLRELMADIHSFNDLHRGVPLISRAVLVARLRHLEDQGVVERRSRADESAMNIGFRLQAKRCVRSWPRWVFGDSLMRPDQAYRP